MAQKHNVEAVILAGGQGARFWPISRLKRPKQFLSISANGESLIQATARRIESLVTKQNVTIVTNQLHETLIREQVPYAKLLCEPVGKNTAASIALAAAMLPDETVMVVLPADHAIADEQALRNTLQSGIDLAASEGLLVTVGVPPTFPHTGYGYIRRGTQVSDRGYQVLRFFEKPNLQRAKQYCEVGGFYWNSGMFCWRAGVFIEAVRRYMPDLAKGVDEIRAAKGKANEAATIGSVFQRIESVSVDFGILELSQNCAVIEAEAIGWNDVGSWDAWAAHFAHDINGNLTYGDALAFDSNNCVIYSKERLTAVLGLKDIIVIDAGDAQLVCHRDYVQDVRRIVDELNRLGRKDLI